MNRNRLVNQAIRIGERALRRWARERTRAPQGRSRRDREREGSHHQADRGAYPGDFTRTPTIEYDPVKDDEADPGEVVWTWVPFEEDFSQGKDRPVLVIGHDGPWLLCLQVSTVGDPGEREWESNQGRYWVDIGTGGWDNQGRPSEARVNRIIRIDPGAVRRIGARLDPQTYRYVARQVLRHY